MVWVRPPSRLRVPQVAWADTVAAAKANERIVKRMMDWIEMS